MYVFICSFSCDEAASRFRLYTARQFSSFHFNCKYSGLCSYPFNSQYPRTNSPNWPLYITLKNELREFDKRSKYFLLGDHFINSHNQILTIYGYHWEKIDVGHYRDLKGLCMKAPKVLLFYLFVCFLGYCSAVHTRCLSVAVLVCGMAVQLYSTHPWISGLRTSLQKFFTLIPKNSRTCLAKQGQAGSYMLVTFKLW